MKISFITTVYNEEKTISKFLDSLFKQTQLPDEIVIVDGGSHDRTVEKIKKHETKVKNKFRKIKIIVKKGNRSVGRNEAIKQATGDIILCSDAGNELNKNWIKNIVKPFKEKKVDVVAGYYEGRAETVFQKSVIPYALVMPDKIHPSNFLPATRSVAFTKAIWKKIGGFNESLSHNEDYVFARKLRHLGAKIVFTKDAIVYWQPRNNLKQTFIMLWRFAFGDAEAHILRSSVLLLFARYFLGLYFIFLCLLYKSIGGFIIIISLILLYILWAIYKNYRYVQDKKAFFILPLLQFTADAAVLSGTMLGLLRRLRFVAFRSFITHNKTFIFVLLLYAIIELALLQWGIPNNHPFPYHMDEWHQLQAVRTTFAYGTPNVVGAANGTMLHYLITGFYLIPFALLHVINLTSIKINDLAMRETIFVLLRLNTLFLGLLSLAVLYKIASLLKLSTKVSVLLFTFTPIWLMLSGYFKYDIALMFWILCSLWFFFRFAKHPTKRNYILAAIPASLAIAVKVSAIPTLIIYVVSYFWFYPKWQNNFKLLTTGTVVFLCCVFLFGMPDTLFGKGNIYDFFYINVIAGQQGITNAQVGMSQHVYLLLLQYPILFGHGLVIALLISGLTFIYISLKMGLIKSFKEYKILWFIIFALFLFMLSLVPLQIYGGGNRSLVVLPFFVLVICYVWKLLIINSRTKYLLILFISLTLAIQFYESFSWIYIKSVQSPQSIASDWLKDNLKQGELIGIENIPIYQNLPDLVQKEFYYKENKVQTDNYFQYQVIDTDQKTLPKTIVITNGEFDSSHFKIIPKKLLIERLKKEKYQKVAEFKPNLKYFKVFGTEKEYYFSWLVAAPLSTTVYRK